MLGIHHRSYARALELTADLEAHVARVGGRPVSRVQPAKHAYNWSPVTSKVPQANVTPPKDLGDTYFTSLVEHGDWPFTNAGTVKINVSGREVTSGAVRARAIHRAKNSDGPHELPAGIFVRAGSTLQMTASSGTAFSTDSGVAYGFHADPRVMDAIRREFGELWATTFENTGTADQKGANSPRDLVIGYAVWEGGGPNISSYGLRVGSMELFPSSVQVDDTADLPTRPGMPGTEVWTDWPSGEWAQQAHSSPAGAVTTQVTLLCVGYPQ